MQFNEAPTRRDLHLLLDENDDDAPADSDLRDAAGDNRRDWALEVLVELSV